MITAGDIVDFIWTHKSDRVFKDYTFSEVAAAVARGLKENTLLYAVDLEDNVVGMLLAVKQPDRKVLYVEENMAMNLTNLRHFAKHAKEQYPGWTLEAHRHGRKINYNTELFYRKMAI